MKLAKILPTTLPIGFCVCILFLVTGCLGIGGGDAQPTLYYTLEPVEAVTGGETTGAVGIHVGLEKVNIPGYLDRKEIVVRTRHNELRYTANHLWAERLGGSLPRVLAQNITRQMNKPAQMYTLPWPDVVEPDLSVSIEVHAFEGQENPDSEVLLELSWNIRSTPDGTVLKKGTHQSSSLNWDAGNPLRWFPAPKSVFLSDLLQRRASSPTLPPSPSA